MTIAAILLVGLVVASIYLVAWLASRYYAKQKRKSACEDYWKEDHYIYWDKK